MTTDSDRSTLGGPGAFVLPPGTMVFRVHRRYRSATAFVPANSEERVRRGRFDASYDDDFSHYYCALSMRAAVAETLLHGVPSAVPGITLPRGVRDSRWLSSVEIVKELVLASLLPAAGTGSASEWVSASDESAYPRTRAFSQALRQENAWAQGLIWLSKHDVQSPSVILFGDRCDASFIRPAASPLLDLEDDGLLPHVNALLSPLRIAVS